MRFIDNPDLTWDRIGRSDPYYGVLTNDRYRSNQLTDEALSEFFATGDEHIKRVVAMAKEHLGCELGRELALDFGCGVGRLVIPMARRFKKVVAVDISPAYLSLTKENCEKRGLSNVALATTIDELSAESNQYDFVHSYIVFIHLPFRHGLGIICSLVDLLKPGGVGALHVLHKRDVSVGRRVGNMARKYFPPLHWALNALAHRPVFDPLMQVNEYPLDELLPAFHRIGVPGVYIELTHVDRGHHAFLLFRRAGPTGIESTCA